MIILIILWSSHNHLMIIVQASYDHHTIILWSSHNHLMIITQSYYNQSSYDHHTIILWLPHNHLIIILQSSSDHLMISLPSFLESFLELTIKTKHKKVKDSNKISPLPTECWKNCCKNLCAFPLRFWSWCFYPEKGLKYFICFILKPFCLIQCKNLWWLTL